MIYSNNNNNRPKRRKGFHSNYIDDNHTTMFDFVSKDHDSYSIVVLQNSRFYEYGEPNIRGGVLRYKNYVTNLTWDKDDRCYRGKIEGVGDILVTWESDTYDNCEKEFQLAVEDYIMFCSEIGILPAIL